jgi:hypothetical protein
VHVRVPDESLSPRVENAQEPDLGAEMLRVGGDLEQGGRAQLKQPPVEPRRIPIPEREQRMREREDDVHIRHVEHVLLTRGEPAGARLRLTLRTVPVATRVIGDGPMSAGAAVIDMPAERGGPTARDRAQHGSLLHAEPRMLVDEDVTLRMEDVGHLTAGRLMAAAVCARAGTGGGPPASGPAAVPADSALPASDDADGRRIIVGAALDPGDPAELHAFFVQVLDATTGALLWQDAVDKGGDTDFLYELHASDGLVFAVGVGGPHCLFAPSPPSNCDALLRAYDVKTGTLVWERELDLAGASEDDLSEVVTAADGVVYVFSQQAPLSELAGCCLVGRWRVQAFEAARGRLLWESVGGAKESAVYNMIVQRGRLVIPVLCENSAAGTTRPRDNKT